MDSTVKESILGIDRPTPRYTSYPTAPHFQGGFDSAAYETWLKDIPQGASLSLYLHTPFCPQLCWFCGCHTKITQREEPVRNYLDLLEREVDMLGARCADGRSVTAIHFGGGSPTIIQAHDFKALMERVRATFPTAPNAEISVEVDPRNMTEAKAVAYAQSGVTRASLGVQDFDPKVLQAINRPQPFHASYEAIRLLREYGVKNINIDLMYGLPHQTVETMRRAAENALLLNPDRIALFGYAHVPWMKKHMRLIPAEALPSPSERLDLFETASDIFTQNGYVAIGIDHFAKPDDPLSVAKKNHALHRNFQGYTVDEADVLLALGVSAISRLPQGFVQNSTQMPAYREHILAGRLPVEKSCPLSAEDRLREDVIQTLMCEFSADIESIAARHGFSSTYLAPDIEKLAPMERSGLVEIKDRRRVEILHPHAARPAAAAFDAYLRPSENGQRHVTIT